MKPIWVALPLVGLLMIFIIGVAAGPLWVSNTTWPIRQRFMELVQGVTGFSQWFGDVQQLNQDNKQLTKERNQLLSQIAQLQGIGRENQTLRQQLNIAPTPSARLVLAETAGLVQQHNATYLLINRGDQDHVKVGQIATAEGILVGRVDQVSTHTALVALPQTLGNAIPVVIQHDQNLVQGLVQGNFNLTAKLNQVLPTETIKTGDTILTSTDGGIYPPNIVVGKVGTITKSDTAVFQSADVNLLWNATTLQYVLVETSP